MCCCFCCCHTRFSMLIYMMVISAIAFIYGIVTISQFGSSTEIYKYLLIRIDDLENNKNSYNPLSFANSVASSVKSVNSVNYQNIKSEVDRQSMNAISEFSFASVTGYNFGVIKKLKGIECGLGIVLFVFPGIFLGVEILFLIFVCGIKEYKVMSTKMYNIFNIIKIVCIILSTLFIFLSVLYSALLIVALLQKMTVTIFPDSCTVGIVVGMVDGIYGFYFYIALSCAFCTERKKFMLVGSEEKPGPDAKYDLNENPITQKVIPVSSAQQLNVQNNNNQLHLNPNTRPPKGNNDFSNQNNDGEQITSYRNLNAPDSGNDQKKKKQPFSK